MLLSRRTLKTLYHLTVYCVGLIVLVAAIGVSCIRLVLPDIGEYRTEVEAWVSRYMGYPVVIHSMQANWKGWVPQLYLTDIDLLNKAGTDKITGFEKAQIQIDPLKTLLERQFMPKRLVISGLELSVARLANGAIFIEGVNIGEQSAHSERSDIADWLFKQDKIILQDAQLEWIDVKHSQEPIVLSDVTLELRADDGRVQLNGYCELPRKYGKSMNFAFDSTGDLLSSEWSADLYLEAHDINPDNWYKKYRPSAIGVAGGNASIKVWSHWLDTQMHDIQGQLSYQDFTVQSGAASVPVEELSYRFKGERNPDKDWHFQVVLDTLLTENGYWPESQFEIAAVGNIDAKDDYRIAVTFDYLKLDDMMPLLIHREGIPEQIKARVVNGKIRGELSEGSATYAHKQHADDTFFYDTAFTDVTTTFTTSLPDISGLSGRARGSKDNLLISIDSHHLEITAPDTMKAGLRLTQVQGDIYAEKHAEHWSIHTDTLTLTNTDHSLTLAGNIHNQTLDTEPEIHLVATLHSDKLDKLYTAFPEMPALKLGPWLKRSIHGGNLESAQLVFRGHPKSLPFKHNEGQFQALVNVSDVILEYSKKWPLIEDMTAELFVDNEQSTTTIAKGKILNADIHSGGIIRVLDHSQQPKQLELQGKIAGSTNDLNQFINDSPLTNHKILGPTTKKVIAGNFNVDLDMLIAINSKTIKPEINSTIHFQDAAFVSLDKKLQIDEISGPITFTRNSVTAEKLTASLDEQPVDISIHGPGEEINQIALIKLSASSDPSFITRQLKKRINNFTHFSDVLETRLDGRTDWSAEVSYIKDNDKVQQYLTLASDLYGMAVKLPAPMGKYNWEKKPLSIKRELPDSGRTEIEYKHALHAIFIGDIATKKLQHIEVTLGNKPTQKTAHKHSGLLINGSIAALSFQEYLNTIKAFSAANKHKTGFVSNNPIIIDLEVGDFDFYKQHFADMHIEATRAAGRWEIYPTSFDTSGFISLSAKYNDNDSISATLDKLVLKKSGKGNTDDTTLNPLSFPALDISVDDFVFREMHLGQLKLVATHAKNGILIKDISMTKPGLNIVGHGTWTGSALANESYFTASLNAEKMSSMLGTFNYDDSPVKKGKTSITLLADWSGSPLDFSLDRMNGNLKIDISKGQILQVHPSAGRLFGLLSLQTLPRRLSLDFTDLLGKGLAFDKIEGDFAISQGNAYTNNLHLTGPVANVAISGRTGLAEQDYDQIVTVTPQVADNLPVTSALFGPVGIWVGAVLYLAGNMFKSINNSIDNILSYQYTITGPWENPSIEKFQSRNAKEQGQNQISQLPDNLSRQD